MKDAPKPPEGLRVALVTGLSGGGKASILRALEDIGYEAVDNPPTDTRAYFRGECLRRFGADIAAASWDSVIFDLGGDSLVRIPTLEPLRGSKAHVGALLDSVDSAAELVQQLTN